MQPYPPLGTLYAAAVLRQQGISTAVFDSTLLDPESGFPEALRKNAPMFVVIYEDDFNFLSKMCLTRMREVAFQMIDQAIAVGATVIVHGSDATDHALEYLGRGARYVVTGEAEFKLRDLLSALRLQKNIPSNEGLAYLDDRGVLVHRPAAPRATSWADLPSPARDLIDIDRYRRAWIDAHGRFSLNMVASRGCPYRCNWCAKPISGDRFHIRPAASVAAELCELGERYGADHVWFGDDVFALDRHWVAEFAGEIESRACRVPFKIQSRADLMTPDTVDCLRRAGCVEVWMGVESGSQKVLDAMDKGLKISQVAEARENLRAAGIRACYFLQFGYPGEGWAEMQRTFSLVRSTRPDDIGISLSYPLPNTAFHERVRHQMGQKRNWRDSDDLCVMFTAAYSSEFYLAVRDALHAEVDSWSAKSSSQPHVVEALWKRVLDMQPGSRNANPTQLEAPQRPGGNERESDLFPINNLFIAAGEL